MSQVYKIDQRGEEVTIYQAIKDLFRGMFYFKGYTTRKGYFYGFGFTLIMMVLFYILAIVSLTSSFSNYSRTYDDTAVSLGLLSFGIWYLLAVVVSFPNLASSVRRFRDAGISTKGIWILVLAGAIPYVNVLAYLVQLYVACQPSESLTSDTERFLFREKVIRVQIEEQLSDSEEVGSFYRPPQPGLGMKHIVGVIIIDIILLAIIIAVALYRHS